MTPLISKSKAEAVQEERERIFRFLEKEIEENLNSRTSDVTKSIAVVTMEYAQLIRSGTYRKDME